MSLFCSKLVSVLFSWKRELTPALSLDTIFESPVLEPIESRQMLTALGVFGASVTVAGLVAKPPTAFHTPKQATNDNVLPFDDVSD